MKVCNNKDFGVNWNRCRLLTCPSICWLPCVSPADAKVEDEEFSLDGITEMTEVGDRKHLALLHNLPKSLRTLAFGNRFNQRLHHVRLPPGLQNLTFGDQFNQNLDHVTWPAGLQSLTFGDQFNQKLDKVTWPEGLQSLTFEGGFHQSLENVAWPAGLSRLTVQGRFQSETG